LDPIAKQILNDLKCPLCGGQIDLFDFKIANHCIGIGTPRLTFNFCCANNWEHYHIWFPHWETTFKKIDYERIIVYTDSLQYCITQIHTNRTYITISNVNLENRIIEGTEKTLLFEQKMFDFSNTNREKILNRTKTILVFQ